MRQDFFKFFAAPADTDFLSNSPKLRDARRLPLGFTQT
jgi:hypothetical protein